ncbi:U3 small nucleolar RNA-associated protein MPP10 [Neolecta irregularis DAH-3]|uniref:U3 small nucleolar ribonucleoprotein protein MPP10 n=1 Tax=Neolecta irregularis (strain DAH-3) TaxID=1198029 RepID=A0A1U7LWS3_NEOID|nr:U3 small nucleolar RNA-associated protein MPP10 [Neolecta irregularis DAH-3]|eukprot:OLL27126.1 U3 small nucleolar RNA-associated protein MPP10 [Neolecta irregularis DAH-3]
MSSSPSLLFTTLEKSPRDFLNPSGKLYESALALLKDILDPIASKYSVFEKIALDGLDVDQIVEQARYVVNGILETVPGEIQQEKNLETEEGDIEEEISEEDVEIDINTDDIRTDDVETEDEQSTDFIQESNESDFDQDTNSPQITPDVHGLNDKFFSIENFNRVTQDMENEQDDQQTDDGIDYNADPDELDDSHDEDLDSDNANEIRYKDFFAPTKKSSKRKPHFKKPETYESQIERIQRDLFEDNEPEEVVRSDMSKFEKKQALLKQQIHSLEQENIGKKKWTLVGEAKAKDRPVNSLLEEDLEFERGGKPVPVITQQVTNSIEEIIRSRVAKGLFDDVLKRLPQINFEKSTPFELDDSKSKKSLAQLYQDDYTKPQSTALEKNTQHEEVEKLWKQVSHKLDSLSSWHYTPKPVVVGLEVLTCAPTIEMEDSRPDASAFETQLAPQEIYNPGQSKQDGMIVMKSGVPVSKDEMSREDKRRMRRRQKNKKKMSGVLKKISKNDETMRTLKKGGVVIIGRNGEKKTLDGKTVREKKVIKGGAQLKL